MLHDLCTFTNRLHRHCYPRVRYEHFVASTDHLVGNMRPTEIFECTLYARVYCWLVCLSFHNATGAIYYDALPSQNLAIFPEICVAVLVFRTWKFVGGSSISTGTFRSFPSMLIFSCAMLWLLYLPSRFHKWVVLVSYADAQNRSKSILFSTLLTSACQVTNAASIKGMREDLIGFSNLPTALRSTLAEHKW